MTVKLSLPAGVSSLLLFGKTPKTHIHPGVIPGPFRREQAKALIHYPRSGFSRSQPAGLRRGLGYVLASARTSWLTASCCCWLLISATLRATSSVSVHAGGGVSEQSAV